MILTPEFTLYYNTASAYYGFRKSGGNTLIEGVVIGPIVLLGHVKGHVKGLDRTANYLGPSARLKPSRPAQWMNHLERAVLLSGLPRKTASLCRYGVIVIHMTIYGN